MSANNLQYIEAIYGKDWEKDADNIHALIAAAESTDGKFTDVWSDPDLNNADIAINVARRNIEICHQNDKAHFEKRLAEEIQKRDNIRAGL